MANTHPTRYFPIPCHWIGCILRGREGKGELGAEYSQWGDRQSQYFVSVPPFARLRRREILICPSSHSSPDRRAGRETAVPAGPIEIWAGIGHSLGDGYTESGNFRAWRLTRRLPVKPGYFPEEPHSALRIDHAMTPRKSTHDIALWFKSDWSASPSPSAGRRGCQSLRWLACPSHALKRPRSFEN